MNKSALKKYAPQARKDFIAAVTQRAQRLGLDPARPATVQQTGDVLLIDGQPYPASWARLRSQLHTRIKDQGFAQVMDAMAYTWFNRLVAIRYMELHGFLDHGYRVLSHPANQPTGHTQPEILDHINELDLPGLDRSRALDLKLAGNRDEELYREVVLAQCHRLHTAMPFLFESLDDATELLLPDGLLRTDSILGKLVTAIDEADWQDVEIIGWLYQFYIEERKDEVIGKVVKSEDIPAATQLFTPSWIVKYMVQNSLGAQWLATYPDSKLKEQMEYYIEPAEQTDEVKTQLAAITPSKLNPEELTLIDPACGSGHILVEAYAFFKAIYLERGYRQRDVPQLILEKNLFGLDIDERAAQLTGFAMMMKGRADDRRLFERGVKLNVMALVDSPGFDAEGLAKGVEHAAYGLKPGDLTELKRLFEHATTFGSLIQVPEEVAEKLPALKQLSEATSQDLFVSDALKRLGPLVQQAEMLAAQYDAVVANPPYMSSKFYCSVLKDFVNLTYADGKADLYGAFTLRNTQFAKQLGYVGMITIPSWMFLSSFEPMRAYLFRNAPIASLIHNGRGVWGSDFGSCAYILRRASPNQTTGRFLRLFDKQGSVASNEELERRFHLCPRFSVRNADFEKIPGIPVAYWLSKQEIRAFETGRSFAEIGHPRVGMQTSNNAKYLRLWWEIVLAEFVDVAAHKYKWIKYLKGGGYRRWGGNLEYLLHYNNDPKYILEQPNAQVMSLEALVQPKGTWGSVTVSRFSCRLAPPDTFHDIGGHCFYPDDGEMYRLLGFLNSRAAERLLGALNPTLNYQIGDIGRLPLLESASFQHCGVEELTVLSQADWDAYERSWDFQSLPLLTASFDPTATLESSYTAWTFQNRNTIAKVKRLEEENNHFFINAYGLADELIPDVPFDQITLTVNPAYRYGGKLTDVEQWTRFRRDTMQELASYAIGCMMGRYSLDAPGLIYAHSGNQGFDPSRYTSFPADDDGIVPITDEAWFDDDGANRIREFVRVVWGIDTEAENMAWLAESLGSKASESADDTIRRYLSRDFYKDHLQTYKKRPIYWLFSSGKHKAFEALVYLHRYNAGTLSRMRMEYVVPLQPRMQARIDKLEDDITSTTSSAQQKTLRKQKDKLAKQLEELRSFDEKLRHYADQRITLDLDDGVKVNYGKFGDLLAEVKAVTGGGADE